MAGLLGHPARVATSEAEAALTEIVWTDEALGHVAAIRAYVGQFNPGAARNVADGLRRAAQGLAVFPHRGRLVPGTAFREMVTSYPYVIRYLVDGDTVVILRVRHTSRRPTTP